MAEIHRWAQLTSPELAALGARDALAVLAIAAIEQHGAHLPLATDVVIGEGIVDAALGALDDQAASAAPILILPTQALGASTEHSAFAGTLSLPPELAIATIEAIGDGLAAAGIRRLVLFNSHGGNKAILDLAALKLRAAHGMLAVKASYFRFAPPADALAAQELAHGLHGGALETAMMWHLAPALVRAEHIGHAEPLGARRADAGCVIRPEGEAAFAWMAQDLHASGVAGDAREADAALGARLVAHFAARLAEILVEAAAFDMTQLRG